MTSSPLGRVVEIAEDGRYLAKHRGFLTINSEGVELARVPLDDITAVIATSLATIVSCSLLAELATRGIVFVVCGHNFAPAGFIWPVQGHHAQQRRMEAQQNAGRALSKRLWASIVAAKIRRQGWALEQLERPAGAFARLAGTVRSGDPENVEAQAARRYWKLLMGASFRRDVNVGGTNALLNYGYAILRAATARAIIAAGLHPGIGLFHRHPHNAMPLADDLMEPFRPIVDLAVVELLRGGATEVTTDAKRALVGVLWREEATPAGTTPMSTIIIRFAASVAESFLLTEPALDLPVHALARGRPSTYHAAVR